MMNGKKEKSLVAGVFTFFSFVVMTSASQTPEPFQLGPLKVAAGESQSGYLPVPEKDGLGCAIPLTVIHGSKKGKVLALVAGVHGYEYPPILALYRLKKMVDPRKLAGTLILVHIANPPSFQKRTIYYNPYDWKNLNRVFPGDPQGTLSQRIAHVLNAEVIHKCDCLIDLHCGDGNEALIPYSYWMISGNEKTDHATKEMVLAFGIRHIVIDTTRTKELADSKYLGNTAILQGRPAITTESGYLGGTDEESIVRNVNGILNVMRHFQMIEGEAEMIPDPVWIDLYEVVYSNQDGLFYPHVEMGSFVAQGQKVGHLTDYLGNFLEDVLAPFSGIVLYIIHTPPANRGEPLFEVGRIKQ
ncbi:MAG: M14 family metallopeptidase [Candidatus Aminicenantales bacterium]